MASSNQNSSNDEYQKESKTENLADEMAKLAMTHAIENKTFLNIEEYYKIFLEEIRKAALLGLWHVIVMEVTYDGNKIKDKCLQIKSYKTQREIPMLGRVLLYKEYGVNDKGIKWDMNMENFKRRAKIDGFRVVVDNFGRINIFW